MADEAKTKDSRDRARPEAPEAAAPENEQRRFRGEPKDSQRTAADERRDDIRGEETAVDAPMDPEDDEFLKSK
jgi:hypothetical protein